MRCLETLPALEQMTPAARKLRAFYAQTPGAPLYRQEFWLMPDTIEAWKKQGMPADVPWPELFLLDPPAEFQLRDLGWCEAGLEPRFEECRIEDRGECEVVRDFAGRHVLYFKNRRTGFMPEYVDHPVKNWATWEADIKWRMNPATPARYATLPQRMAKAQAAAAQGWIINEGLVGGFMYLRSLFGPEEILYAVYDQPDLIHDCMRTWFALADAVIARHQEYVTLDEIIFAEDITYNHGPLISPDMIREFLFPYYQQLIANLKRRQRDPSRKLHVHVDTDGLFDPIISLYREGIGMNFVSPFEVASGSDVVRTGREHPDLLLSGGIDKRVLAHSKRKIDETLERILPPLRARGGYIPTIDHGTPVEVPYEHYLHYRKRCVELGR